MPLTQEMFRFVATRRSQRALMHRIGSRLIRDRRAANANSLLVTLYGPGPYESKLAQANSFAASAEFVDADDTLMRLLEPALSFFRQRLSPEVALADLATSFAKELPLLAALIQLAPPAALLQATLTNTARLWDSLYAQTLRGCDRYVSTNYLVDGLRVYQVLRLWWFSSKLGLAHWAGGSFDDYHTLIDLQRAQAGAETQGGDKPSGLPAGFNDLKSHTNTLVLIDSAQLAVQQVLAAELLRSEAKAPRERSFNDAAQALLKNEPALAGIDLAKTSVDEVQRSLQASRATTLIERERTLTRLSDPQALAFHEVAKQALATKAPAPKKGQASMSGLVAPAGEFRVPLSVGPMKPALVGDLILVEQELVRYDLREIADVESIMRGERRERTLRTLARTSQTSTTVTLQEQEESSSTKVDERFSLSTEAQKTATENFGIEGGVSVSAKYGPVQVNASVNASYDTSKTSSDSSSQEYAKTVTEEASKRVKSSIKETSSITILSETQNTSLRGFNNEKGTEHVNGIYRWINRVEKARLLNYGRRLMFSFDVHQPAAFHRAMLAQDEAALAADLVEPIAPVRISRGTMTPLPESNTTGGVRSFQDITETNYAQLAALYDVKVEPPPPEYLTGSKAIAYPEAMEPQAMSEHDHVNDPSLVMADNTLTLDPSYRLTQVAVFAPKGKLDTFGSYVDALKLGEDGATANDNNLLLVQVANKSFYLQVHKDPDDNDKKVIDCNFNSWQDIDEDWEAFGEVVQPALPITFTANFEGMAAFTVMYKAYRLPEAFDRWRARTYADMVKGYNTKKQAYDQALAVVQSRASSSTEAQTFQLRSDQYRSIETTELKRGCIELMSRGTAAGYTSITTDADGNPRTVFDEAEGATLTDWRSPLANGAVAAFFEQSFEWENMTYEFHPYYWAGGEYWKDLARASGADPLFEQFLRAGNASVVVPVRPGYERPVILFFKTSLIFAGGYLSLFNTQDMLDVYADVELGRQFDPPLQIGEDWEVNVPTSLMMLQEGSTLPNFEEEEGAEPPAETTSEPEMDETVPF